MRTPPGKGVDLHVHPYPETFFLHITAATNAVVDPNDATVTIIDSASAPFSIDFSSTNYTVAEPVVQIPEELPGIPEP